MDVSRVSHKTDALLQESAPARRDTGAAARPEASERVERPKEVKKAESPEPPKPVLNTQGQTTGTRINTSA